MPLGDYDGSGIFSHNEIEAGDFLSIAPRAVDHEALHSSWRYCTISKYGIETPRLSVLLLNTNRSSVLDGPSSNSIRPFYKITLLDMNHTVLISLPR
jgi:hypothetical protein